MGRSGSHVPIRAVRLRAPANMLSCVVQDFKRRWRTCSIRRP